jgi:phosphoribosylformylglycinamidine cyclo-ligase
MVLAVPAEHAGEVAAELDEAGEAVSHIGEGAAGPRGCTVRGPAGSWGSAEAWEATHTA